MAKKDKKDKKAEKKRAEAVSLEAVAAEDSAVEEDAIAAEAADGVAELKGELDELSVEASSEDPFAAEGDPEERLTAALDLFEGVVGELSAEDKGAVQPVLRGVIFSDDSTLDSALAALAGSKSASARRVGRTFLGGGVDPSPEETPEEPSAEAPVEAEEEKPVAKKAAAKPRAKRAEPVEVEIPASSMEFIQDFPIDEIVPREKATRFRGKETERVLSEMIKRFGWVQPLTLDAENRIVDGQYRYEIAKKWGVKSLPVLIASGVSADDGTTDLFHMLSGRIIEWDKWNYPATDAVLKELDGGLTTETILDFEAPSEKGELRDLAREVGWFIEIIPKSLSGSSVTLETLAKLLKKQLAGKYHYDPAQLLYIEALRAQLEAVRKEMVAKGDLAGGVKPKLDQHLSDEAQRLKDGEAIAEEEGYVLELSEDGKQVVFTADREIEYIVNEVALAEERAKVQVRSARDMIPSFKIMADKKRVGLKQFKTLATYFGDMTEAEAGDFFNSTTPVELNLFVDKILEEDRTISPDRSKHFPMTEAEIKAEEARIKAEDDRKAAEREKKEGKAGLSSLLVPKLKELLKAEGLPLGGAKAVLIARLEEAGFGPDGTKADVPESADVEPSEELEEPVATLEDEGVDSLEAIEDEDDVSMVFAAESMRATPEEVLVGEVRDTEASVEGELEAEEEPSSGEALVESLAMEGEDEVTFPKLGADAEPELDLKSLKKRGKALKAKAEEEELSEEELKELKSIKKQLKAAKG